MPLRKHSLARGTPRVAARGKIIVFGILFWYPLAGVTYQFLHYLLALRRLGYDPYYIEDSGRWIYDPELNDLSPDVTGNLRAVVPVLESYGFSGHWAFRGNYPGGGCYGLSDAKIKALYREADAFLNVTGAQELREEHLACRRRIYVETDPVAAQVNVAKGDRRTISTLGAHDTLFSFGLNFGATDCLVPLQKFQWLPTCQPIALDLWENSLPALPNGSAHNTIATWKNSGKDLIYNGQRYYWSKHREFLKFLNLPLQRNVPFELAAGVDKKTRRSLEKNGWQIVDSIRVSRDIDRYRNYICNARGEFTVAKDQNIRLRSGWFSDRSACYLAASRPVITQDTGFGSYLPTGKGLFAFRNMQDILAAVDEVERDYIGNCKAAREIASEHFAAEKVLNKLMNQAGL
ncbi:MAG TPA: hypothetical protein VL361_24555 [Candidatus Limnocylindrales bacterium]|nr:hypothetical protein [Candidatus Limnocylindrales bacterium]